MSRIINEADLLAIAHKARAEAQRVLAREVPFTGSMGAAEIAGYEAYSLEARLFSPVFLHVLHKRLGRHGIVMDKQGFLVVA